MKFYSIDDIFTSGKYTGMTLAEVFDTDPKYVKNCIKNDADFYISDEVRKAINENERDNRLIQTNLDELSDEELEKFMKEMDKFDDFDSDKLDREIARITSVDDLFDNDDEEDDEYFNEDELMNEAEGLGYEDNYDF